MSLRDSLRRLGQNHVYVQDTNLPVTIDGGGDDTVDIGSASSVHGIAGPVTVNNPMHLTKLLVDDSADSAARLRKPGRLHILRFRAPSCLQSGNFFARPVIHLGPDWAFPG